MESEQVFMQQMLEKANMERFSAGESHDKGVTFLQGCGEDNLDKEEL